MHRLGRMEWMLQVVDEFDDALGALRHGWLGVDSPSRHALGGSRALPMPHRRTSGAEI